MSGEPDDVFERERRLDEVLGAYLAAQAARRAPDRGELLARHPDLAADLTAFFADQDAVARWTGPLQAVADGVRINAGAPDTPRATRDEAARPGTVGPAASLGDYDLLGELGRGGWGWCTGRDSGASTGSWP